ncbi:MAG: exodeoxyribonuclease VII small subunit [Dethiosulfovibrio peptidovorans]|nr:MAG: exodeoxyribonuclease VII small subunit [Dethiosulfovibrio peptidovorans]
MSFSEKMMALEDIVHRLEVEALPLEDALELFEQGVNLVKDGRLFLSQAEQRISVLTEDGEQPFSIGEVPNDDR